MGSKCFWFIVVLNIFHTKYWSVIWHRISIAQSKDLNNATQQSSFHCQTSSLSSSSPHRKHQMLCHCQGLYVLLTFRPTHHGKYDQSGGFVDLFFFNQYPHQAEACLLKLAVNIKCFFLIKLLSRINTNFGLVWD